MDKFVNIKKTGISYCQSCGKDFQELETCYYAPIDNNIVCTECVKAHSNKELRIYTGKE